MSTAASARLTPAGVWWLAARPATLAASVAPVLAGTAVAVHDHAARPAAGLAALVVALAMQVGVNYANDYSDFVRGADARRVGPVRAAASGVVPPGQVRNAAVAAFTVAAGAGLALSLATDWRLLVAGALAVAAGWLYTGGPRPYGYLGLGEVFVFVFFGLMATAGTVYVQELRITPLALAAGVAMGCFACNILVLNNLRDLPTDREAGKRTLAVRVGPGPTRALIAGFFAVAYSMPVLALAVGWAGKFALLPLITGYRAYGIFASTAPPAGGRDLVLPLKRCAELEVWWALAWTAGMLAT